MNLAALFLFYVAKQEIISAKRLKIMLWVIVGSGLAVSAEAFAQFYLQKGLILHWQKTGSPIGTIGNTNYLGCYLLFPLFASLALKKGRYLFPVFVWALFISRARASWLGFGIAFGLWAWLTLPKKAFVSLAVLASVCVAVAFAYFPGSAQNWAETNTLRYRSKYWQASVELWKENLIFGTGISSYRNRVYDAQGRLGAKNPDFWQGYNEPKPRRVHNDYLESLNDGGLLYAITFWGFIAYVLANSYRRGLSSEKRALFCAEIAVLISALFFFPFKLADTSVLFFVQLGALCHGDTKGTGWLLRDMVTRVGHPDTGVAPGQCPPDIKNRRLSRCSSDSP